MEPKELVAGDRPGNSWLQYHADSLPCTQEDWDNFRFVEKTHWGYYCWPKYAHLHNYILQLPECVPHRV